MKKKPKLVIVECEIYHRDILVALGASKDDIENFLNKKCGYHLTKEELEGLDISNNIKGRAVLLSNHAFVLYLRDLNIPTITHELLHIVNMMYQDMGIEYDLNNDEPAAYLIEHIMRKILNELTKKK